MKNIGESTQLISDGIEEEWICRVDGKDFVLNEGQIALIHQASQEGYRGLVSFSGKSISIAHISSMDRTYRGTQRKKRSYEEIRDASEKVSAYRMIEE